MDGNEKYIGSVFDNRYKILQTIGIGGMAVVFKAEDMLIGRTVAIKILKDDIARDEVSVKRFMNESRAVAMLSHKNIVNIYDVSMHNNIKYIVMEYIEGITLKNYMTKKGALSFDEMISYTEQILCALNHAHAKGIVHRDIKPQNIMLLKNGIIKVMDFGIAKLPNTETVTMADKAIGTVYYISPEQASSGKIDARSDIYSLGVMMYEMATGTLPFSGDTAVTVALKQINDTPTPPHIVKAGIPQGLEQIIMRSMEKDPRDRYQSAADMLAHIRKLRENPHIIFRPVPKASKTAKGSSAKTSDSRSMMPIVLGVASAFLIIAGISAYFVLSAFFSSQSQSAARSETIEVNSFVGSYYTVELSNYLKDSDMYSVTVKYEYNANVADGCIIDQEPKAGSKKKITKGQTKCELVLTVSRGAETVELPNYMANEYRAAKIAIEGLGLVCKVEHVYSNAFETGYVVRSSPEAGSTLKINDTVTIYVSKGAESGKIAVLNYVGKNEAAVLRSLIEFGLIPGNVTYVKDKAQAGNVISQSIDPGKMVNKYTTIDFIVSGGPKYGDPTAVDPTTSDPTAGTTTEPDPTTSPTLTEEVIPGRPGQTYGPSTTPGTSTEPDDPTPEPTSEPTAEPTDVPTDPTSEPLDPDQPTSEPTAEPEPQQQE